MALTDKLTNIAAAIREKGGTTELLTLDAMPTAIANLPTGGGEGGDYVPNPIVINGDCNYLFANNRLNWLVEGYSDRFSINTTNAGYMFSKTTLNDTIKPFYITSDSTIGCFYMFQESNIELPDDFFKEVNGKINSVNYMFYKSTMKKIPSIQQKPDTAIDWSKVFNDCHEVEEIGDIHNFYPSKMGYMFLNCYRLKHCPNFINPKPGTLSSTGDNAAAFCGCYSLRSIPTNFLKSLTSTQTSALYHPYGQMFASCASLDEIVGLNPTGGTLTSSAFGNTFKGCYRLKRLTFNTNDDGTPIVVKWKKQTINLDSYAGWAGEANSDKRILDYNSGITAADEDNGRDTNPNYWTKQFGNSRFGHAAAVELINTLPDASAYLATQSGTGNNNTVKFYSNAGSNVGDSVNSLTEEEIAVAAAKGWTIAYGT